MVLLTLSAWLPGMTPSPDEYASPLQNAFLYTSLYVVALGTGGIKVRDEGLWRGAPAVAAAGVVYMLVYCSL
jgi:hypothetical protein